MEKVIIRAYTEQNLGDDMFVKYLCVRYPAVDFYIICKDCYKTAFDEIPNLNVLDNNDCICHMNFRLQIIIGGSIFMQSNSKSILKKFLSDKNMMIHGVPTYIVGANFGPYKSKTFLFLYKHWLKSIERITFRDEYSYNLFRFDNMEWAPDILFNYDLPVVSSKQIVCISCIKNNQRSGLKNYDEHSYFKKLAEIAETYSKLGFEIILAGFSKVQEDDVAAKMIYNFLSSRAKSMTEILIYQGNINNFLEKFLSSTYIIGTRFHSVILGWSAGIPTFPICYNEKLIYAINSYGFKGNYTDIDNMNQIDFSFVDSNRTTVGIIKAQYLKNKSKNHFLILDQLLRE